MGSAAATLEVMSWLDELELSQYYVNFMENDFDSLEMVGQIEDKTILAEIGILSIGHQVKLMKSIRDLQPRKEELLYDEKEGGIAKTGGGNDGSPTLGNQQSFVVNGDDENETLGNV